MRHTHRPRLELHEIKRANRVDDMDNHHPHTLLALRRDQYVEPDLKYGDYPADRDVLLTARLVELSFMSLQHTPA